MASAPAAIVRPEQDQINFHVFFMGANGQLYERFRGGGQQWQWEEHGLPPNGAWMASAPAAIAWHNQDGIPQQDVFFEGSNGELIEHYWNSQEWQWINHGLPPDTYMASAPAAIVTKTREGVPSRHVFLVGANGELYERWTAEGLEPWQWNRLGLPPGDTQMVSAPAAVSWDVQGTPAMNVFCQGGNGQLVGIYWDDQQAWKWGNPDAPEGFDPDGTHMASAPAAIAWDSWWQNVFYQGANGALIEAFWQDAGVEGDWAWGKRHGTPPGTFMASAAAIVHWIIVAPDPGVPNGNGNCPNGNGPPPPEC
jgi:hypothetical protein